MQGQDLEALWSLHFQAVGGSSTSAGVVVIETDKLFGGDSWYYYVGSYKVVNGKLTGTMTSTHYAGPLGSPIHAGLPQATIDFEEIQRGHDGQGRRTISVKGTVRGLPGRSAVGVLTWRQNLP